MILSNSGLQYDFSIIRFSLGEYFLSAKLYQSCNPHLQFRRVYFNSATNVESKNNDAY